MILEFSSLALPLLSFASGIFLYLNAATQQPDPVIAIQTAPAIVEQDSRSGWNIEMGNAIGDYAITQLAKKPLKDVSIATSYRLLTIKLEALLEDSFAYSLDDLLAMSKGSRAPPGGALT